eukprot:5278976-Alexandrium_andersonii.AAC.1
MSRARRYCSHTPYAQPDVATATDGAAPPVAIAGSPRMGRYRNFVRARTAGRAGPRLISSVSAEWRGMTEQEKE